MYLIHCLLTQVLRLKDTSAVAVVSIWCGLGDISVLSFSIFFCVHRSLSEQFISGLVCALYYVKEYVINILWLFQTLLPLKFDEPCLCFMFNLVLSVDLTLPMKLVALGRLQRWQSNLCLPLALFSGGILSIAVQRLE